MTIADDALWPTLPGNGSDGLGQAMTTRALASDGVRGIVP
jgi:hypothetical protein